MRRIKNIIGLLLVSILFVSCSKSDGYKKILNVDCRNCEPRQMEVLEYNKALFGIDTADFEEGIREIQPQFKALLGDTLDSADMMYLKDYVTDTFILKLNELAMRAFPDSKPCISI